MLHDASPAPVREQGTAGSRRQLSSRSFRDIATLVEREAGIVLHESKRLMATCRIARRLDALGLESFDDYCRLLETDMGLQELPELIGALTTNVTAFFRERHHFNDFEGVVLPDLVTRARRGERIRLWSAGCSTGAEPYSIALLIARSLPEATELDIKVLATDIDPASLRVAENAEYAASMVRREVPRDLIGFFEPSGHEKVRVRSDVRQLVAVRRLNLVQEWPIRGAFDAVFCRNVVIYFGAETTDRIWSRFAERIVPGGRLYVGHSERVKGPAAAQFEPVGITAYRRRRPAP